MGIAPIGLPLDVMTLVDLLRYRAHHQPDQQLYTFLGQPADTEAQLTVGALDRLARRIGGQLQHIAQPGERVLLLYPPGLDYIAAFFGCLYANMIAVPAYLPPSNRPAPRLQSIIEDAQLALAITNSATLANLQPQFAYTPQLGALQWLATDELMPHAEDAWQPPGMTSASLAFLQYTSGSTGTPKGVMLSHGNLLHNLGQIYGYFGHSPASRGVIWLPPYHDMGLIGGILQPLYGGFPVTLMSPLAFLQRPLRWLETISRTGGTTSGGPNFAYDLCVRKSTPEQRAALDLSSWTVAFTGAEPVRAETLDRFAATFAECGFRRAAFYPCYGLAEATLIVTGVEVAAPPAVRAFDREALTQHRVVATAEGAALVGCGAPLAAFDQQIAIVDPETARRRAPGEIGEIWVSGPSVAGGYWNRPEETAQTFGAYLAEPAAGPFLRTGDLGFVQDGELFITGRLKDLIIIHGRNYYPHDLEATAEQSHAALQPNGSAAFGVEIGGEERLVIVHEVQRQHRSVPIDEVAAAVRRAVAEQHEAQVYAVVLIKPGSLPRTSSGKIQHQLCRAQFMAGSLPVLSQSTLETTSEAVAPPTLLLPPPATLRTLEIAERKRLLEAYLADRVAQLLGIAPSTLDRAQPPSAFGLDSLAAVELQHAVELDLGLIVPMSVFLETPSIAALATQLAVGDTIDQPGVAAVAADRYPLSYGQRALWFLQQIAPESPAYTIARAVRIGAATFDGAALRRAFQVLVERHPALRTTIHQDDGALVQQVQPAMMVAFEEEDASAWSSALLEARLAAASRRPFDLAAGPLLRVLLFHSAPGGSILLLTVHHSVADGWSLTVLLRELELLYGAADGKSSASKPTSASYAEYVHWQAELLAGSSGDALWQYWRQQLGSTAGSLPTLDLPLDHSRPPLQTYAGATERFSLDARMLQSLKALAAGEGATLFMLCLAAFQTLLYRYTGQAEILVGSPTAGRSRAHFADTIGYFVNPVVLRAAPSANLRFVDLLRQVRQTVLDALAQQEYPFPLLVERLSPNRDLSRSPLVQVMFGLEKSVWLSADERRSELRLEPFEVEQQTVQFDLELMLTEQASSLDGALHYNTDLFEPDSISRLIGHYQTLLQAIVAQPDQRLGRLPLLTPAEGQTLRRWNDTALAVPQERCIHQLFEAHVARTPEAAALVWADRTLSYAELDERSNRLAHHLHSLGLGPDVPVGVFLSRSPEFVIAALGVLKAGGAYLPIDPATPVERIQFMLADAQAPILLTQQTLPPIPASPALHVVYLDADWPIIVAHPPIQPPRRVTADNLAYVIYTSGSTGVPKGVEVSHRSAVNLIIWHQQTYELAPSDRASLLAGLAFDAAVWELWPYLAAGASVHVPTEATRGSPPDLIAWLAAQAITLCFMPTPLAEAVIAEPDAARLPVRALLTGGDLLHPCDWSRLPYPIVNHYGPTENTVVATCGVATGDSAALPTIGRPIANTQVYLLDAQMQPVPIGVSGELYIGGAQLARGYRSRPALTATQFIPDPFSEIPGARLYRTGDRARYRADGQIEFLGRTDDQVKLRGYRVELGEIETSLRQHLDVRDAVVLLREDRPGDRRLVAYVVGEQRNKAGALWAKEQTENQEPRTKNLEPGTESSPSPAGRPLGLEREGEPATAGQGGRGDEGLLSSLRAFLRERLPEYMLPSAFVQLDALPLTANGKIDRRVLPAPETGRDESAAPLVAPRSSIEQAIAAVWQEVLDVERVGVHDNFFDLGGHSLLLAQVHTRLRELLRADLALVDLFRYPTISALAAYLAEEQGGAVEHRLEPAPQLEGAFAASHIAIIGMDGRFPGAANIDEFWDNLCAGTETISFFSDEELLAAGVPAAELRHPSYVKARGVLRDIDLFDAEFFGITPREAQITDPQQRLFLECAWNALERAGYDSLRYAGRIGMFAGAGFNTYLLAADRAALVEAGRYQALIGNDKDFLPTRVSYKLNLRGPSVNVQTACSSSLVAVHLACQSLRAGESDMVLAGGVTIGVPHTAGYLYEPGGTASPDGHCRAFDANAQGMVFSSGVGVVVLKRLDDALRDGDTIHAVIRGSAINNDGAGKIGYTAPSVDGQALVIADALRAAQVDPASIGYVEAHGTGTPLGDPIELAALNAVFQPHIRQIGTVALGSAKTNIGHTDAAAGIAGLIKAVLALKHRQIPPSLHFESPNPQIDFARSPFYVNTTLRDWTGDTTPRRAGVSSFGIGGTNAHVVLEEAPTVERSPAIDSPQLLVLSARSDTALDAATANLATHLHQSTSCDLADVAYTLQAGRRLFDHRRALL
ncbi:MAG TPA: amino acid adenylation domain-containing protein, partial [Herpetosiphonaceae bacterium]